MESEMDGVVQSGTTTGRERAKDLSLKRLIGRSDGPRRGTELVVLSHQVRPAA
jgi:hypothetical protein